MSNARGSNRKIRAEEGPFGVSYGDHPWPWLDARQSYKSRSQATLVEKVWETAEKQQQVWTTRSKNLTEQGEEKERVLTRKESWWSRALFHHMG